MDHRTAAPPSLHAPIAAEAAPAPRGRRRRTASTTPGCIPIVDAAHALVGWTDTAPIVENGRLRHAKAERLLGGAIFCTQIALIRREEIVRAGGPADWVGPWRCLALCRAEHAQGLEQPSATLASPPVVPAPASI
jgi:hypothetical protein